MGTAMPGMLDIVPSGPLFGSQIPFKHPYYLSRRIEVFLSARGAIGDITEKVPMSAGVVVGPTNNALTLLFNEKSEVERRSNDVVARVKGALADMSRSEYRTGDILRSLSEEVAEERLMLRVYRDRIIATETADALVKNDVRYWRLRSFAHAAGNRLNNLSVILDGLVGEHTSGIEYSVVRGWLDDCIRRSGSSKISRADACLHAAYEFGARIRFGSNMNEAFAAMPDWFEDMICNLLSNTVKNTPNGRTAELFVDYDPVSRTYRFANSTPPIPEEVHQKIGRMAVHGDSKKRGSGSGLLIDFNIARLNGGEMWVDRGVDADPARGIAEKGPTFYVRLAAPAIPLLGSDAEFEAFITRVAAMAPDEAVEVMVQLFDAVNNANEAFAKEIFSTETASPTFREVVDKSDRFFDRYEKLSQALESVLYGSIHKAIFVHSRSSLSQVLSVIPTILDLIDGGDDVSEISAMSKERRLFSYTEEVEGRKFRVSSSRREMTLNLLNFALGGDRSPKKWEGDDLIVTVREDMDPKRVYMFAGVSWPLDPDNDVALNINLRILGWTLKREPSAEGTYVYRLNFGKTLLK